MSLAEYAKEEMRVNGGKSKVMRCSRYGNGGPMYERLNGEPLGKWAVLSTLGGE